MSELSASQVKALEALKQSHTELHRLVEKYQHSQTITSTSKAEVARVISQLSFVLASL